MPATRPIVRDPLERPSAGDRAVVRLRAPGIPMAQRPLQSNPIGNALAGSRQGSSVTLRGGKFTPYKISGGPVPI